MSIMRVVQIVKNPVFFWVFLCGLFLAVHLPGLLQLPVFADETIYIRWAQLIRSDWQQYLFFPLNDGKTPLFIWMLVPFLQQSFDPIWAGRLLAVLGGLIQMILIVLILKTFRVNRVGQLAGALITIIAPFWFFHHRMVLMDGWLTVWLSLALLSIGAVTRKNTTLQKRYIWAAIGMFAIWAGLLTKVPFVLALPGLLVFAWREPGRTDFRWLRWVGALLAGGVVLFATLAFSPVFPQLFSRGSDFLLPINEVVAGRWRETLPSIGTYIGYFGSYVGWGAGLLALIGLVYPGKRRIAWLLAANIVLFCTPIWVLGKMVYPRYLFPATLFLTLLAGLGAGTLWSWSCELVHTPVRKMAIRVLLGALLLHVVLVGLRFSVPSWTNPDKVPFVAADRQQYLMTWSSGHGLREVYQYLWQRNTEQKQGKILVATEGNFGSLPDGLLLLNFNQPLENVWIEGIGYPVDAIPPHFYERIQPEDTVLLVINSDRLKWEIDLSLLLQEYCRPRTGPCLQVWDITSIYPQFKKN